MTRAELETWIESRGKNGKTRYEQLMAVARRHIEQGAEDVVQAALTRALESVTFVELDANQAWPWLVDAIRSAVEHARRSDQRAKRTHRMAAGAFLSERYSGSRTPVPSGDGEDTAPTHATMRDGIATWGQRGKGRIPILDAYQHDEENGCGYLGPRGMWHGEYTVAHLGPCPCGEYGHFESVGSDWLRRLGFKSTRYRYTGQAFSRIELGRDRERPNNRRDRALLDAIAKSVTYTHMGSVERLAGFALAAVVTESTKSDIKSYSFQVIGCKNGCRTYTGEI